MRAIILLTVGWFSLAGLGASDARAQAADADALYRSNSSVGCGGQTWSGTIHFAVVDGALGARRLDCRRDVGARRVDALLSSDAYVQRVFDALLMIAPPDLRAQVDEFVLTASHPHSAGGIEAYISPANGDVSRFNLGLSIGGFVRPSSWTDLALVHVVIHEYAHILSLNAAAIEALPSSGGPCATHQPWPTHCAREASLIEAYRDLFWPNGVALARREAAFVSGYAETNVEEDFAETFASWVLEPHAFPDGTVLGEKAEFLAKQPELLEIRAFMRAHLGLAPVGAD